MHHLSAKDLATKLTDKTETLAASLGQLMKCERCGNTKPVGKRCKSCGSATVENAMRPQSEDHRTPAGPLSIPQRSATHAGNSAEAMKGCNTCHEWKHHVRDFTFHDHICNGCFKDPGFSDEGTKLAGRWRPGPTAPTRLERKESGITKYQRPSGVPLRGRRPSVTTFGYEAWQNAVQLFEALERRWEAWGGHPIAVHDIFSKKTSHELVATSLNPPPLCDACSENPAAYACPSGMLALECAEQHFACEACFTQGFNTHKGVLGGKDREYNVTILRAAFAHADVDGSGALDFLEAMYFFYVLLTRVAFFQNYGRATIQQLHEAYKAFAGPNGMTLDAVGHMFKEAFRVMPPDLPTIFERHVGSATGTADFIHTLWIMYHVARPQSPYLRHLNKEEKTRQSTPEPDIEYQAPAADEGPAPEEIPTFVKAQCRVLQMLGQGGMSVIWMVEYAGQRVAAKVPKAGIKPRHKKEMFAAARVQMVVRHPNVLRVLGVFEDSTWPCILLEMAEAGDLTEWQIGKVDLRMQCRALMEVAQGMAALHSCDPPLIHRDLKGQNVFLTKSGTAKVADFDFVAKAEPPTYSVRGICGTPGFMAPEMLAELSYGVKADVFSFGSLLYEITHKTFPFSKELEDRSSLTMEDWFELAGSMTLDGTRPRLDPRKTCPKMHDLITRCWDGSPFERPSMSEACGILQDLRDEFISFTPPKK